MAESSMITGYKDKHEYTDERGIHSVVYLMDCMDLMQQLPDKSIQLACVDPPYGIGVNISMGRRKGDKKSDYHKFYGKDLSIPPKEYFDFLKKVSVNQIVWGGNYMTEYLPPSSCWLLWDKLFSEDVTFAQFELAWTSFDSSAKKFDKHPAEANRIHPTQKPTGLYNWIFARYAKEGDTILDTHLGSGSSRISAAKAGLPFIGCELDSEYFYQHCKRFDAFTAQKTILFPK
jgi:site-specific DNA-methyltransferase (adenine-specific)